MILPYLVTSIFNMDNDMNSPLFKEIKEEVIEVIRVAAKNGPFGRDAPGHDLPPHQDTQV